MSFNRDQSKYRLGQGGEDRRIFDACYSLTEVPRDGGRYRLQKKLLYRTTTNSSSFIVTRRGKKMTSTAQFLNL